MNKLFALIAVVAVLTVGNLPVQADPVGGPTSRIDRVDANSTMVFYLDCWGGEWTAIRLVGDGDTDLDLYVYDHVGNLIASGTSYSDIEEALVLPHYRQTLIIKVVNRGHVWNQFRLSAW